jgi:hypothetical protein
MHLEFGRRGRERESGNTINRDNAGLRDSIHALGKTSLKELPLLLLKLGAIIFGGPAALRPRCCPLTTDGRCQEIDNSQIAIVQKSRSRQ